MMTYSRFLANAPLRLFGLLVVVGSVFSPQSPAQALVLQRLGSYDSGITSQSAAEISAYDPTSQRLFVTNAANNALDVLSLSNPSLPTSVTSINLSSLGGGVNSVAIKNGIVAAAIQGNIITDPGVVAFFDTNGSLLKSVTVGALPDMLTFTPDGLKVLVANEGEPAAGVNPNGSVSIIDLSSGVGSASVLEAVFTGYNGQENNLRNLGVRIFPGVDAAADFEPEYIAISPDSQKAWVSLQENNTLAVIDIASATVEKLLPLGLKNHNLAGNGLDPSDRDSSLNGGINIRNFPVLGMYMPDAIAPLTINGKTYIVTANEGDDRGENVRVSSLTLDPTVFPNAASLQQNINLGRLNVSSIDGDPDGDGDYDALYAYGARSLSIWDGDTGALVYDSGDLLEQLIADRFPAIFNTDGNSIALSAFLASFDTRSDNKGPEPEGVTVAKIGNRTYAFLGLERTGGITTFDVSDPFNPFLVDYVNDYLLGDRSPEGVLFIPQSDSPNNQPLLVVTNENSGTTVVYSVSVPESSNLMGLMLVVGGAICLRPRKS